MIVLRCTNDDGVIQDLPVQENLDLLLDISAIENASIGDVYGISSQEFAIPGTDEVNQFFGNIYNLGATPSVALQNSIECQVLFNGAQVFKGKLYINSVITDQQGFTIYNSVVVNETVDFKFEIQDKLLTEYDFSRFNHNFTYANVSASWSGNLLQGSIVYPFIEYGIPEADADAPNYEFASVASSGSNTIDNYDSPLRLEDFKPAIRAKDVVDVIFSGSGYEYTSSFFNTDYFESLYVLTTPDDTLGPTNVSPVSQSVWAYNASGSQVIPAGNIAKVEFDAEVVDNSNRFDLSTERYTAATTGNYQYQVAINYTITNWGISNTDRVGVQLRKNGSSLVATQQYIPVPQTGSAYLQGAVSLTPGDYLEVEVFYNSSNGSRALNILNELGKPSYLPNGYVTYFQMRGPATSYGTNVDMAGQFPDDLKAQDFLEGLIEKFNLVVEPVPNSRNLIRIEPYETWIGVGTTKDWTDKVDRSVRFEIKHPILDQPRIINFSDEEDEDILNKYTIDNKGVVYGSYQYVSDSDLANGERSIGKVFAATPVTGIPNGRNFIIPHLCTSTNLRDRRPFKFKPRLLYNNGLQPVPDTALGIQGTTINRGTIFVRDENATVNSVKFWNQMTSLTSVPVNYSTGQDLHFNNDRYTPYFQASANGKVKGDAYRTYWATYLNSLYDVDARKLTCNVYLKPTEIQDIALNDRIFIDGQYYRINNISGANLSRRASVQVELIKVLLFKLKFPRRLTTTGQSITLDYGSLNIDGTGRYINVDTGATVGEYSEISGPGAKDGLKVYNNAGTGSAVWDYQEPFDASNQFSQTVLGNNQVATGASKVSAVGNNNQVKEGSEVSLVVGSNNLVAENTSNATVVGQNHSVSDQVNNAQILGGFANAVSSSSNQITIVNGINNAVYNTDYGVIINGESSALRDSDFTTAINSHTNEVILNGSGHAVIGLNREGDGLDLLNTRANSNWLGDTYLGGALFRDQVQLECGDGYSIILTGSAYTDGRHENLYILNWSGLSPGTTTIELPSATNNDYENVVYQFQANGTFDGGTTVEITGLSGLGQTINGEASYTLSDAYAGVTLTTYDGDWVVLSGAGSSQASYLSAYNTGSISTVANVSASVVLSNVDLSQNISVVSGSRITFAKAGTYDIQFSAQIVKTTATNAPLFIWIAKNGVDVPWTNTEYIVPGNANDEIVLAWNWYVDALSNDYYEIKYEDQQGNVSFQSKTGVTGPDVPSWIVTVGSIGGGSSTLSGSCCPSASYATTSSYSSYAVTASYALNGGGGGTPGQATQESGSILFENIYGEIYGSALSPVTGNLTVSGTSTFVSGAVAIVYHTGSTEPTISGATINKKVGTYSASSLNVITLTHTGNGNVLEYIAGDGSSSSGVISTAFEEAIINPDYLVPDYTYTNGGGVIMDVHISASGVHLLDASSACSYNIYFHPDKLQAGDAASWTIKTVNAYNVSYRTLVSASASTEYMVTSTSAFNAITVTSFGTAGYSRYNSSTSTNNPSCIVKTQNGNVKMGVTATLSTLNGTGFILNGSRGTPIV